MAEPSTDSVVFIASGAAAGAGVSATIGGMGLAGGFGAVGIGMAPVTAAGAVAGAAVFGAFKAIEEGDTAAFGAIGIGAVGGVGVSATIGGMGLAGGFGAVGIGMGTMAAAGGVVGLGVYGLYKAFKQEPGQRMAGAIDAFDRMESKVLEMDAYTQALLELEPLYAEEIWKQKFAALEIEEELEALKAQISPPFNTEQSNNSKSQFANDSQQEDSQLPVSEFQPEVLSIEVQSPQSWKCIKTLKGHESSVNAIAISPDGQTLVSGSNDQTVKLWNLKTGKHSFTFFGQSGEVSTVAISPDGKKVFAGGFDNKISSWQLDTKALLPPFGYRNSPYSHSGFVSCLAFSKDSKILASASGDKTIRLWGGYTRELKRTLNGHSDTVFSVAVSPDSEILVSGSADKTIRIWHLNRLEQSRIITGHSNWVTSVAISPDGNILASGSTDGTIKLWNLHTGELIRTLDEQSTGVFSIAINPDGKTLASGSRKAVKIWDIHSGELLYTLSGCSPVAFSSDGQILVSGGEKGTIKIWRYVLSGDESTLDCLLLGEWWEVLGVDKNADSNTVKLAYRGLARQYHPDINRSAGAIAKMQAINKAYEEFLREFGKVWF